MRENNINEELMIKDDIKIICHIARWDILKDYNTLTEAVEFIYESDGYRLCKV